jgi:hypothetical protein
MAPWWTTRAGHAQPGLPAQQRGKSFRDVLSGSWYGTRFSMRVSMALSVGPAQPPLIRRTDDPGMFMTVLGAMAGVDPVRMRRVRFRDVKERPTSSLIWRWAPISALHPCWIRKGCYPSTSSPGSKWRSYSSLFRGLLRGYDTAPHHHRTGGSGQRVAMGTRIGAEAWKTGLLSGDGGNFNPTGKGLSVRRRLAGYAHRQAVENWYSEARGTFGRVPWIRMRT